MDNNNFNNNYNGDNDYNNDSKYDYYYDNYYGAQQQQGQAAQYDMAGQRESLSVYTAKTYMWMFLGLMTTFILAVALVVTDVIYNMLVTNFNILYLTTGLELLVVIALSARITKLTPAAAKVLFFVYAALNSVTISCYLVLFGMGTCLFLFAATAGVFGLLSVIGFTTKKDLSKLGPVLMGGLIAIILYSLFASFAGISGADMAISIVGIVIFLGFTAYDTKKIRAYYHAYESNAVMLQKASIFAALQLYLDFINLFLYIVRIFGRRSN